MNVVVKNGPEEVSRMGKNLRASNARKKLDLKIPLHGTRDGMVISDVPKKDVKVPGSHRTLGPLTTKFKRPNVESA